MHDAGVPGAPGGAESEPAAGARASYADRLLREVRFHELCGMVPASAANEHQAFEIMQPLLTRVHKVAWSELVPPGSSWRDVVHIIRQIRSVLAELPEWSIELIGATIPAASAPQLTSVPCAATLLYQCVLCSEYRLPLAGALWHLGQTECATRLDDVGSTLEKMNLIG